MVVGPSPRRHIHRTISKDHPTAAIPTVRRTRLGASVQTAAVCRQPLAILLSMAGSCTMSALNRMVIQEVATLHLRQATTRTHRTLLAVNSITLMTLHLQRLLTPIPTMTVLTQARIIMAIRLMCQSVNSKLERYRNRAMHSLRVTPIPLQLRQFRRPTLPVHMRVRITTVVLRNRTSTNIKSHQCKCRLRMDTATTRPTLQ